MPPIDTSKDIIKNLLTTWDLAEIRAVDEIITGMVYKIECTSASPLILKNIGKDSPEMLNRFEFEYDVLQHLDRGGISVALPVPNKKGELLVKNSGNLYTLSPYLTTNDQWMKLDFEGLERLNRNCGTAIARLHTALMAYPTVDLEKKTWKTVFPDDLNDQWLPVIRKNLTPQERSKFEMLYREIEAELNTTTLGLPMQLIHRDCHHGNIIVDGEEVSGFIDFDHLSLGSRIYDLADFILHMIKRNTADQERISEFFKLFPVVIQGYEQEMALSKKERQAIYYMMVGVLLMFIGWFFEVGMNEYARQDLEAFAWMVRQRQRICDLILA